MEDKNKIYAHCQSFISERLEKIYANIKSVSDALGSESKSSAGDKHETGRAMLQLEREKLGEQLREAEKMKVTLDEVRIDLSMHLVGLGSLIITSKAEYFIAISAGLFHLMGRNVYCISVKTPIAQLIMGKKIGDTIVFNQNEFTILHIF